MGPLPAPGQPPWRTVLSVRCYTELLCCPGTAQRLAQARAQVQRCSLYHACQFAGRTQRPALTLLRCCEQRRWGLRSPVLVMPHATGTSGSSLLLPTLVPRLRP